MRPSSPVLKDFFISYNRHDKQWAEWLAWTLEEAGYTVVIQAWDFRPGGNFVLDMQRASATCQKTIAMLSEHYLQSTYTPSEWGAAFAQDPQSLKRKLIPVRVGECRPEGVLAQIVYVDLVGVSEPVARELVLGALQERAKPAQEPGFPGAVTPKAERVEPDPVAFPEGDNPTLEAELTLATFEFDVVTVSQQKELLGLLPFQVKLTSRKERAKYFTEDLGNGVGLEMVSIPCGQFFMGLPNPGEAIFMGSPATEVGSGDVERPQHLVRVSPFFMGKYPVTQEQWLMVSELPKVKHDLDPNCSFFKGLKRPVDQVNWLEAVELCDRLSLKTKRRYRLPSEAEWEYACRSGTTTPFHFGETMTTDLANYCGTNFYKEFGWSGSYGQGPKGVFRLCTTDVGSFPPNAFGLYDMHGNVCEWCADHWHGNYKGAPTDGSAWIIGGNNTHRLSRGGSRLNDPRHCRSASRVDYPPDFRANNLGFRVVCSAP